MDWTNVAHVQAFAVAAVAVLVPLAVAVIRRWRPDFSVSDKWKKAVVAYAIAFIGAAASAPGTWRERLLAGVVAVVLSQGVYGIVRITRAGDAQ